MKIEKGKPVPFTIEEKVILGVKEAARLNEDWSTCNVWVTDLSMTNYSQSPITETKERVSAEGTCSLGFRCMKRAMILNPKQCSFKIQIIDSNDSWGLPDVKVESFEFKPL